MLAAQVKPISYFKANAASALTQLAETGQPLIITQNGEARAVLQDIASFERGQETLALLKLLALGDRDVSADRTVGARSAIAALRKAVSDR